MFSTTLLLQCVLHALIQPTTAQQQQSLYPETLQDLCPDYTTYARVRHRPYSDGPLELPYQRPVQECRRFTSLAVERVIDDLYPRFQDRDLAHIFQNAFPNTIDTTVLWHVDGVKTVAPPSKRLRDGNRWQGAQSFIVTGDINAMWIRDSTGQTAHYQALASKNPEIYNLLLGQIATQAEFLIESPYCNAFQPPNPSGLDPTTNGQDDYIHPTYEPSFVFECKYELDSLANFLSATNKFHDATGETDFLNQRWFMALEAVMRTVYSQSQATFDPMTKEYQGNAYTFQRVTNTGTETLNLKGVGNPLANGTGLVRSAFRPSDDATIYGYLIPSNAMMSVELGRTAKMLTKYAKSASADLGSSYANLAGILEEYSRTIRDGIYAHAVVNHPRFGKVFAYEIDGYGSTLMMDDANIPSLLSLPKLGFVDVNDEIYQNTRKMILSSEGNPYYLTGAKFSGIGGPHIGLRNAWPMSALMQAMTSSDPAEIVECLERVKNVSLFGLINESVDVERGIGWSGEGMTRSWFAWANSVFSETIIHVAEHYPELLFGKGATKYILGKGFQ